MSVVKNHKKKYKTEWIQRKGNVWGVVRGGVLCGVLQVLNFKWKDRSTPLKECRLETRQNSHRLLLVVEEKTREMSRNKSLLMMNHQEGGFGFGELNAGSNNPCLVDDVCTATSTFTKGWYEVPWSEFGTQWCIINDDTRKVWCSLICFSIESWPAFPCHVSAKHWFAANEWTSKHSCAIVFVVIACDTPIQHCVWSYGTTDTGPSTCVGVSRLTVLWCGPWGNTCEMSSDKHRLSNNLCGGGVDRGRRRETVWCSNQSSHTQSLSLSDHHFRPQKRFCLVLWTSTGIVVPGDKMLL